MRLVPGQLYVGCHVAVVTVDMLVQCLAGDLWLGRLAGLRLRARVVLQRHRMHHLRGRHVLNERERADLHAVRSGHLFGRKRYKLLKLCCGQLDDINWRIIVPVMRGELLLQCVNQRLRVVSRKLHVICGLGPRLPLNVLVQHQRHCVRLRRLADVRVRTRLVRERHFVQHVRGGVILNGHERCNLHALPGRHLRISRQLDKLLRLCRGQLDNLHRRYLVHVLRGQLLLQHFFVDLRRVSVKLELDRWERDRSAFNLHLRRQLYLVGFGRLAVMQRDERQLDLGQLDIGQLDLSGQHDRGRSAPVPRRLQGRRRRNALHRVRCGLLLGVGKLVLVHALPRGLLCGGGQLDELHPLRCRLHVPCGGLDLLPRVRGQLF